MAADEVSSEAKASLQQNPRRVPNLIQEDNLSTDVSRHLVDDDLISSTLNNISHGSGSSPSGDDDLFGKLHFYSYLSFFPLQLATFL